MRKFNVEVATDENWEHHHRIVKVYACTINGAIVRARKKMNKSESIYQICTRINGCNLWQPVWDFFNRNMSKHFGLKL
jgi:hypothetical protein